VKGENIFVREVREWDLLGWLYSRILLILLNMQIDTADYLQ
jgi:hypothetical protein